MASPTLVSYITCMLGGAWPLQRWFLILLVCPDGRGLSNVGFLYYLYARRGVASPTLVSYITCMPGRAWPPQRWFLILLVCPEGRGLSNVGFLYYLYARRGVASPTLVSYNYLYGSFIQYYTTPMRPYVLYGVKYTGPVSLAPLSVAGTDWLAP